MLILNSSWQYGHHPGPGRPVAVLGRENRIRLQRWLSPLQLSWDHPLLHCLQGCLYSKDLEESIPSLEHKKWIPPGFGDFPRMYLPLHLISYRTPHGGTSSHSVCLLTKNRAGCEPVKSTSTLGYKLPEGGSLSGLPVYLYTWHSASHTAGTHKYQLWQFSYSKTGTVVQSAGQMGVNKATFYSSLHRIRVL